MTKSTSIEATGTIVELLTPFDSVDRLKIIQASMALLGEKAISSTGDLDEAEPSSDALLATLPARARTWAKQNGLDITEIHEVFQLANGSAEIIAVPGNNKKEQTLNAYILTGIEKLLSNGESTFDDKAARANCGKFGCYDADNHSTYLKGKGNEFSGTKEKGWTLTVPGLKRGAELIRAAKAK